MSALKKDDRNFLEKAHDFYAGNAPDWILELASLADRVGLAEAGKRIGYSGPTVSQVICNKYQGDILRVEGMVRGALMAVTVNCPVFGTLARNSCLEWQKKKFSTANSNCVRMYQACRNGCEHSSLDAIMGVDDE